MVNCNLAVEMSSAEDSQVLIGLLMSSLANPQEICVHKTVTVLG